MIKLPRVRKLEDGYYKVVDGTFTKLSDLNLTPQDDAVCAQVLDQVRAITGCPEGHSLVDWIQRHYTKTHKTKR